MPAVFGSTFSRGRNNGLTFMRSILLERKNFGLEPTVALAKNYGLTPRQLATAVRLIREREDEIRAAWEAHFGS